MTVRSAIFTIVGLVVAILFVWSAIWFGSLFYATFKAHQKTLQIQAHLRDTKVATAIANKLARACQTGTGFHDEAITDFTCLIPELAGGYHGGSGCIGSNYAWVEMGGGFCHFGYRLLLDEAESNSRTNIWSLIFYSEGAPDSVLLRFPLAANETLEQTTTNRKASAVY